MNKGQAIRAIEVLPHRDSNLLIFVPVDVGDPRAEGDVSKKVEPLGKVKEVVFDLLLPTVGPGPPRVQVVGEAVEVRGYIAGSSGVLVEPPIDRSNFVKNKARDVELQYKYLVKVYKTDHC